MTASAVCWRMGLKARRMGPPRPATRATTRSLHRISIACIFSLTNKRLEKRQAGTHREELRVKPASASACASLIAVDGRNLDLAFGKKSRLLWWGQNANRTTEVQPIPRQTKSTKGAHQQHSSFRTRSRTDHHIEVESDGFRS